MTASLQPESKSSSRRALLAGALGGIGAWAASAIGRASPVQANDPNDVLLGGNNTATATTRITNNTNASAVFEGIGGFGMGLYGQSNAYYGVQGYSNSYVGVSGVSLTNNAVFGINGLGANAAAVVGHNNGNSTGVQGYSGTSSVPVAKPKTGVFGYANQDTSARGVWGHSSQGIGVYGQTITGYAGYFNGKVFSTSFFELGEIATPGAPGANKARVFIRDNGSGKSQLCVRFATGSVKLLATES